MINYGCITVEIIEEHNPNWPQICDHYFKKTAEATDYLIGFKIVNKITKIGRASPQNSLETVAAKIENVGLDREIPKTYMYISLQNKDKKLLMMQYLYRSIKMEYQKNNNSLDNKPYQPPKFKTKNWVEINDDSRGKYNTNSQMKFKTQMVK